MLLGPPGFNCWFSSAPVFQWCCSTPQGSPGVGRNTFLSSPHLCFIIVYERSGKNLFWSIKNSGEVLNKLKSRGFRATSLSTYDFSTLYTTLPHNLIKEKLINLIEWTFKREGSSYIACNERQAFFTSEDAKPYKNFTNVLDIT